jgi:hypothetical protein
VRALFFVLFLAGCVHSAAVVSNAQPTAPSGNVTATGAIAAAVLLSTIAVAASQDPNHPQPMPSFSIFSDWTSQPVPAMAPEREIGHQDCTQPIDLSAGNLRCR